MAPRDLARSPAAALRLGLALGLALATTLACALQREDVAPNGWWEGYGPVIPHDRFPADCGLCHTGQGWQEVREDFEFDHEAETGFALVGPHARAQCLRCHNDRGPAADFAAQGCGGCHEDVHLGQLGPSCEDCHELPSWRPQGQIAAHQQTRFPLVGAHASTTCRACHQGAEIGVFVPTDTECLSCHAADLARATSPDHATQGWTGRCDECHIPTGWRGAAFNHRWPLTGEHAEASCQECHAGGVYAGTPTDCFSCHGPEFAATSDPDHVALGLPTQCAQCHSTRGWRPADMNHSGVSGACVDCHLDDYLATSDPNHQAAGIPTACQACHNTNRWRGAGFSHDFPINSGAHKNFSCNDCHTTTGNYDAFSCIHCHEHRQSKMADEHDDVNGYVWNSNACLSCHPDGRE